MAAKKVAVITGADSGIGFGISEIFAQHGVDLAMLSYADEHLKTQAKKLSDQYGIDALPVLVDISKEDQVASAFQTVLQHFNHIDYAVNDAGISGSFKLFDQLTSKDFDQTMSVDFRGTFLTMNAEIKQFVKQGHGSMVNITALGTEITQASMSLYIAAKSGVLGLTKSVAIDYADKGIRVNSVSPGAVVTPMTAPVLNDTSKGSFGSQLLSTIPMHRVADPKEIGRTVYFVASDNSSYTTGQNFRVDGGSSTGGH